MDRYLRRGSDKIFIEKMDKSFYDFIKDKESDKFPIKIKMKGDAYLSDYMDIHENMVLIYEELFTFNAKKVLCLHSKYNKPCNPRKVYFFV